MKQKLVQPILDLSLDDEDGKEKVTGGQLRRDKAVEPFGQGTMHTATARWVAAQVLPAVRWFAKGTVCEGAGLVAGQKAVDTP